jgi:hypothetical protein
LMLCMVFIRRKSRQDSLKENNHLLLGRFNKWNP